MREDEGTLLITRCRIEDYRLTVNFEEIQAQRKEIDRLVVEIEDQTQIEEDLLAELRELENPQPPLSQAEIDARGENPVLVRRLEEVEGLRKEKENEFMRLTREQEDEAFSEYLADQRKIGSLRSIFVGWFGPGVSCDDIKGLFGEPEAIESMIMGDRDHRGEIKRCAYLTFKSHGAAKKAVDCMQGFGYGGRRLLFLWNDEEAPSPPRVKSAIPRSKSLAFTGGFVFRI
jgi:hypothetical protein